MNDYVIKAIAADNCIRAYSATTANLVEEARARHNTSPIATAALGRLLTAGTMMGSMLKNTTEKLTLKISGNGPIGGVVVTADGQANVRGYVHHPQVMLPPTDAGKLDVAGAIGIGILSVSRDSGLGEPFTGNCILVSSEIAEDLTYYYATSEQTPSSVALGVKMNKNNTVKCAGGFIIQLMPGAPEEIVAVLEEKITSLPPITTLLEQNMTPEEILQFVLADFSPKIMDKLPTQFQCSCSRDCIVKAISGLDKQELASWIKDQVPIEAVCEFCGEKYQISGEELQQIFQQNEDTPLS